MATWFVLLGNSRLWRSLIVALSFLLLTSTTYAQGMPITPSGLNTQVSDPIAVGGQTKYNITGGTRPEGENGTNLFHSFGDFGVPPNNIANFLNGVSFDLNGNQLATGLQTNNILARVTGGDISTIFGTIQTTGFGNANLFLMNPNGFLFGPNATVNVGGMATFTTADYMRLTDGGRFNANPNAIPADLLTAAPVAAFGFLGSNPAAINFEGGQLTVANGAGITLVGGDINLVPDLSDAPSGITASGRPIQLTSVTGQGEVAADTGVPAAGMTLGTITLGQGTVLSTGDPSFGDGSGGAVSIRGGQFVATGATIFTSPASFSTGSGGDVTVNVTGSAAITDSTFQTSDSLLSVFSPGGFAGPAGAVFVTVNENLTITNSVIDTSTFLAFGDSGSVTAMGKNVTLDGVIITADVIGDESTGLTVHSGAVTLTATDTATGMVKISNSSITNISESVLLDGGPVTITGTTINIQNNSTIDTTMRNSTLISPANGGAIEIHSSNVNVTGSQLASFADGLDQSTGRGGNIRFAGTDGVQSADNIQLTATQVNSSSTSGGGGGNIEFLTEALTISDHTDVGTSSFGQGSGGAITVSGAETVTIESGSRVLTDVVIGSPGAPQGTAGDIFFETQNLTVRSGGLIRAGALPNSTGNAGNITVQGNSPAQSIVIDGAGSGILTNTEGTGAGGNIILKANSVTLTNGATVSASSTGQIENPGDAGSIDITATNGFTMQNSAITTQAEQGASGGDIKVTTAPSATVLLENSRISASVADGRGGGGNISIDPQYVILQNSQILAQAAQGQGGRITITTNLFLPDANSIVNADSGSGLHGTVTIQSPNAPASGKIQPLGKTPLQATSLLNQHCAALAGGEFSSFTVAGRDSLPTEPGSWLASPLASLSAGMGRGGKAEGVKAEGERPDIPILSLRQIAPTGFLTQAFALDWSAGCQS